MGTLIAVYGTLRRGGNLHDALQRTRARFIGAYTIEGYELFAVDGGWFPAIVECSGWSDPGVTVCNPPKVTAELYEVDEAGLRALDRIEGVPTLYTRELVGTYVPGEGRDGLVSRAAAPRRVHGYVWAAPARAGLGHPIPGGDWLAHVRARDAAVAAEVNRARGVVVGRG